MKGEWMGDTASHIKSQYGARLRRILLVDQDEALRNALIEQLQNDEMFEVEGAATAVKALTAVSDAHFDAILVDSDLSAVSGFDLCRDLRARDVHAPIIMMTAADTEADTIRALECGASDSVAKPFRVGVLLARIKAQLRQHEHSEDATFVIDRYSFRPGVKMLIDQAGNRIRLTEKETAILKYLFRAGSQPIARETLLTQVWGYNAGVTTHTLETHIYRLRQKIEQDPSRAAILITEAGGYRLIP